MRRRASPVLLLAFLLPLAVRSLVDHSAYDRTHARDVIASSPPPIAPGQQPFPGALSTFASDPPG